MDEARLIEKLAAIEALHAGATTAGERVAAGLAHQRILERLKAVQAEDPPVEFKFTLPDMWNRKALVALMRRYGLRPFRYRGQRHTTVMTHVSRRFVDETLWPQYLEISKTLESYLNDITDRVISEAVHSDTSEAQEINKPKQLGLGLAEPSPAPTNSTVHQPTPREGSPARGDRETPSAPPPAPPRTPPAPPRTPPMPPKKKPGRNQPVLVRQRQEIQEVPRGAGQVLSSQPQERVWVRGLAHASSDLAFAVHRERCRVSLSGSPFFPNGSQRVGIGVTTRRSRTCVACATQSSP